MNIAGIDYSSHAIDIVQIPHDGPQPPRWDRFELEGHLAFDRARDVATTMPGRASSYWDEIIAVGIEHPGGHYGTQAMIRIQGAILSCIPPWVLVEPLAPAKWRKLNNLQGHASKEDAARRSIVLRGEATGFLDVWPQDAHDAHLIATATRTLIQQNTSPISGLRAPP